VPDSWAIHFRKPCRPAGGDYMEGSVDFNQFWDEDWLITQTFSLCLPFCSALLAFGRAGTTDPFNGVK
jgi:hypothetical protein